MGPLAITPVSIASEKVPNAFIWSTREENATATTLLTSVALRLRKTAETALAVKPRSLYYLRAPRI